MTRRCDLCGTPEALTRVELSPWHVEYDASGKANRAVFSPGRFQERTNLHTVIRGLLTCGECLDTLDKSARHRNKNIKQLSGKPLSGEAWGKFLESRKP